jgi:hypothetical protein
VSQAKDGKVALMALLVLHIQQEVVAELEALVATVLDLHLVQAEQV